MKKWKNSIILSIVALAFILAYIIFFDWGVDFTLKYYKYLIKPSVISFVFAVLAFRLLFAAAARAKLIRQGTKGGSQIYVSVVDGVPNIPAKQKVTLSLGPIDLTITDSSKNKKAQLSYDQIKQIRVLPHQNEYEKHKKYLVIHYIASDASKSALSFCTIPGLTLEYEAFISSLRRYTGIYEEPETPDDTHIIL